MRLVLENWRYIARNFVIIGAKLQARELLGFFGFFFFFFFWGGVIYMCIYIYSYHYRYYSWAFPNSHLHILPWNPTTVWSWPSGGGCTSSKPVFMYPLKPFSKSTLLVSPTGKKRKNEMTALYQMMACIITVTPYERLCVSFACSAARKIHQALRYWHIVRGTHGWLMDSPHKGPIMIDDMTWWV